MSDEWEELGRHLLRYELETKGDALGTAFLDASEQIRRGADISDLDVRRLREKVEQARDLVRSLEEAQNAE